MLWNKKYRMIMTITIEVHSFKILLIVIATDEFLDYFILWCYFYYAKCKKKSFFSCSSLFMEGSSYANAQGFMDSPC